MKQLKSGAETPQQLTESFLHHQRHQLAHVGAASEGHQIHTLILGQCRAVEKKENMKLGG